MPHFKAIILVLASYNKPLYRELRKIYTKYIYANPNFKFFLLYGSSARFNAEPYDLILRDLEEKPWPGMMIKNLKAFQYVENNFSYDFIVRTNLSTFWVLDRLLHRLESLPTTKMYTGSARKLSIHGTMTEVFIGGTGLILSRDLVQVLLKGSNSLIREDLPEDLVLSQFFLNRCGIGPYYPSLDPMHLLEHLKDDNIEIIEKEIEKADSRNCDHFRIKSAFNREKIDIAIANLLLNKYYNIPIKEEINENSGI